MRPRQIWHGVEKRLRRSVPPTRLQSVLGDLEEDYVRYRAAVGPLRASVWLWRETRSLVRAYAAPAGLPDRTRRWAPRDDLRHAWRRLAGRPGTALLCVVLLAVGIGLCTAMFSVIDALVLRPAPFPHGDRLVRQGFARFEPAVVEGWRVSGMFEAVEVGRVTSLQIGDEPTGTSNRSLAWVTPGVFDMLAVRPIRGRLFSAPTEQAGSSDEIVLSESVWRSAFGADPALIGSRVRVNGALLLVVGVIDGDVRFPTPGTVAWRRFDPTPMPATTTFIFGRLKSGIPVESTTRQLQHLSHQIAPQRSRLTGPPVQPVGLLEDVFIDRAVWPLLIGVGLVFVVLCANVSSLVLAQLSTRSREFAMCTALGASRGRLISQAAVEHVFIALAGTAAGVVLAGVLVSVVPEMFLNRTLNVVDIDLRALAAAAGLGVASVLLSGLVPAWLGTRADPIGSLRGSRQAGTEPRPARKLTSGLLAVEIALACSLLVGSAIVVRSFVNLVETDRGLDLDGLLRVHLGFPAHVFPDGVARAIARTNIEAQFAAWPAIEAFTISQDIPPDYVKGGHAYLGPPGIKPEEDAVVSDGYRVGPTFFDVYGIPIRRGRTFRPGDTAHEVVVSEHLASQLWPGMDPLDRTFSVTGLGGTQRVIGVAGEIRNPTLISAFDRPEFYRPLEDRKDDAFLSLRCRQVCPDELAIRARVAAASPDVRIRFEPPPERWYAQHIQMPRAVAQIGGLFAVVGVLTAAGGLFCVLTYAVGRRRREFGIRMALGASPAHMGRLVVRDALHLIAIGVAGGVIGGWIVARSLSWFQYGITSTDPVSWAGVVATVVLVSLAAALRPAREAMRINPVALLREE